MKCPQCSHNHPRREGLVCGRCSYQFVFDKGVDAMTDSLFLALQRKASRNDTFYFTENQLYSNGPQPTAAAARHTGDSASWQR